MGNGAYSLSKRLRKRDRPASTRSRPFATSDGNLRELPRRRLRVDLADAISVDSRLDVIELNLGGGGGST
jgi:hypothetical protein